jgi:hypothetical protein
MPDNTAHPQVLASEILKEAIETLNFEDEDPSGPRTTVITDPKDGETCIQYQGRHLQGCGAVLCLYKPQECIIKIIEECERLFDTEIKTLQYKIRSRRSKRWFRETGELIVTRDSTVRRMALTGTLGLLGRFLSHLGCAQMEVYEDSLLMARLNLALHLIGPFKKTSARIIDFREDINDLAATAARRRRQELNHVMRSVPEMLVTFEKQGRPAGSKTDPAKTMLTQQQRETKVLVALRELQKQNKQSMKAVADELRVNSKTISTWAKKYRWDWEDLKTRALEKGKT